MRLLNINILELESSYDNTPPYAVPSHTWKGGGVTWHDIRRLDAKRKPVISKIMGVCKPAVESGLDYVWVDTCCIQKKWFFKLSETIILMF